MERNIFIPVILFITVASNPPGNSYSPYIGKSEVILLNRRLMFFFTKSSLSFTEGSLAITASVALANMSNFKGELLDFNKALKEAADEVLLMDMPGTRYLYLPSSNTNT